MPDQPYVYDSPSHTSLAYPYSDFNPRAATQAHYEALRQRAERQRLRAQQDGRPLVNFNRHPDSYMIVSTQNVNFEPMPANTKKLVKIAKWTQFSLRVLQEISAIGLLVAVICLKMKLDGPGWVTRVTPAWDALVTMYAVYWNLRPAKRRTAATSGSYHVFALFMDLGLIPLYVFIVLHTLSIYNQPLDWTTRWSTFFTSADALNDLFLVTIIGGGVLAGLHFTSIGIDLYLLIMFRKIARLPPDMNPLEDNLTSRRSRSAKHKHKDSELSLTIEEMEEKKKQAHLSGSTLSVDNQSRSSIIKGPEERVMPFMHSRMGSDLAFSPHNPDSARYSRQQFDNNSVYQDPRSGHSSRLDLSAQPPPKASSTSPTKHPSHYEAVDIPPLPFSDRSRTPRPISRASTSYRHSPGAPTPAALESQQREGLLNGNWYAIDNDATSDLSSSRATPTYEAIKAGPQHAVRNSHSDAPPRPLGMNPPTPPPTMEEYEDAENDHAHHETIERNNTVMSTSSSKYSTDSADAASLKHSATPKGKYYGDLAAAARGVRGLDSLGVPTPASSRSPSPPKRDARMQYEEVEEVEPRHAPGRRVVSRTTGVDIADASTVLLSEQQYANVVGGNKFGRRQVSGKVAEEGRGGWNVWKR